MGKYQPSGHYKSTRQEEQKTWEIKFEGTFGRVGVDKAEATREAEEFLKHLVVLTSSKIISITETGKYPSR
jgi:hypothetical protein